MSFMVIPKPVFIALGLFPAVERVWRTGDPAIERTFVLRVWSGAFGPFGSSPTSRGPFGLRRVELVLVWTNNPDGVCVIKAVYGQSRPGQVSLTLLEGHNEPFVSTLKNFAAVWERENTYRGGIRYGVPYLGVQGVVTQNTFAHA